MIAASCLVALHGSGCYSVFQRMPKGTSYAGPVRPVSDVRFLADLTYLDPDGRRRVDQRIFDEVFRIIGGAECFVLVDMFLYNDFQGERREETRALSAELTEALIRRKRERPELAAVVISDPVNTVYGGLESKHFEALRRAGIRVVLTRLDRLRDSNPTYSGFWRVLARPFGSSRAGVVPSPFGEERVSLRSYLALLNFKANHRKLVIADDGDGYIGLVTSANPHDGSSAHGNVAVVFRGAAVADLLESEKAVIAFSDGEVPNFSIETPSESGPTTIQVLTEGKIRVTLLGELERAGEGDRVDVAVFYLSDKGVVEALRSAHRRGTRLRILLDPNKDAFGYEKNGVPNRPVAAQLRQVGIPVRWRDTHGEQCHAKMLLARHSDGQAFLLAGSANFTRRNLQDYNLETSVAVRGPQTSEVMRQARAYFELVWSNDPARAFSAPYETYGTDSPAKKLLYEFEEGTGMGTF